MPAFNRIGLVPDSGLARTLVRGARPASRVRDPAWASASSAPTRPTTSASWPRSSPPIAWPTPPVSSRSGSPAGPTVSIGLTKRLLNAAEDATLAESLEVGGGAPGPRRAQRRSRRGRRRVRREARPAVHRPMTEIHTVGVLGAGTMGAGIVQVAAEAGLGVLVHDPLDGATRAGARSHRRLPRPQGREGPAGREGRDRRRWPASGRPTASRRSPRRTWSIEAIPEDLALKRDAFRRLDATAADGAILATNTSSLSVARDRDRSRAARIGWSACTSSTRSR